jgi:S-adenosylmethionine uptake transporter
MHKANTNNIFGIICILLDVFAVASMYASGKVLYAELSSNQVVFFFKTMVLFMLCPWVFSKGFKAIITPHLPLHIVRGFLSLTGSLCFMYGLKKVDMISATTIGMLEQILWVVIGIAIFNEKLTKTKVMAVIASLTGAFLVINPGIIEKNGSIKLLTEELNIGFAFIIASVILWACNSTVIKLLGQRATNRAQSFYVALFSSIFAYPAAFVVWDFIPTAIGINFPVPIRFISFAESGVGYEHMGLITLMAVCYLVHILAHFGALKYGEFSVVMPFVYFKAVFAGLFGYLLFDEVVKQGFFLGFALIVLAGIALIRAEARRKRKQSFLEEQERLPKTL